MARWTARDRRRPAWRRRPWLGQTSGPWRRRCRRRQFSRRRRARDWSRNRRRSRGYSPCECPGRAGSMHFGRAGLALHAVKIAQLRQGADEFCVAGAVHPLLGLQRLFQEDLGLLQSVERLQQPAKIFARGRHALVRVAERSFQYRQGAPIERLRVADPALSLMDFRQRVERPAVVGLGAQRLFDELKRARYEWLRFGVSTLLLVQPREVVEIAAYIGRVPRALADVESPLAEGLGLVEPSLYLVELRQRAEIAGRDLGGLPAKRARRWRAPRSHRLRLWGSRP